MLSNNIFVAGSLFEMWVAQTHCEWVHIYTSMKQKKTKDIFDFFQFLFTLSIFCLLTFEQKMHITWNLTPKLTLTESTLYQRNKVIGSFWWTWSTGKTWFLKSFSNFQVQRTPWRWRYRKTKSQSGGTFHVVSINVVAFDATPWKIVVPTNILSRNQK